MLTPLRSWILRLIRQTLGTQQILEQRQLLDERNERRHLHQMDFMLALGNAITYSVTDPEQLKATTVYRRCAEIISWLAPMDVDGGTFVRVGQRNDGGYVMFDALQKETVDAAYGFGISQDWSWDEAIADRGIDVYMFDHTIEELPKGHPRCHAFGVGVTGHQKGPALRTLRELLAEHGHTESRRLIMKMDIEGCEWDVFDQAASEVIGQFSQIVVEFHRLTTAIHDEDTMIRMTRVFKKLNQTHQCVHVHANTTRVPLWVGPLVLPDILETTYVRRSDVAGRLTGKRRQFPSEIDLATMADWPDVYLGTFSVEDEAAGTSRTNTVSRRSGGTSS